MSGLDVTQVALAILGLGFAVLGWFARELWGAVQKLKDDLNELRVLMGRDYIRYDRLQDALKPVMESLAEIKQALERKADK